MAGPPAVVPKVKGGWTTPEEQGLKRGMKASRSGLTAETGREVRQLNPTAQPAGDSGFHEWGTGCWGRAPEVCATLCLPQGDSSQEPVQPEGAGHAAGSTSPPVRSPQQFCLQSTAAHSDRTLPPYPGCAGELSLRCPAAQRKAQPAQKGMRDLVNLVHIPRWEGVRTSTVAPPREAGPAQRPTVLWTAKITTVLCTVALNCPGFWSPGRLVLSCGGQAGHHRVLHTRQTVPQGLLPQGLLELKQARPAPDDLPDHKAG